jgi:hypothetical protein
MAYKGIGQTLFNEWLSWILATGDGNRHSNTPERNELLGITEAVKIIKKRGPPHSSVNYIYLKELKDTNPDRYQQLYDETIEDFRKQGYENPLIFGDIHNTSLVILKLYDAVVKYEGGRKSKKQRKSKKGGRKSKKSRSTKRRRY